MSTIAANIDQLRELPGLFQRVEQMEAEKRRVSAPAFSPFRLFPVNENALSDVLAGLLDPAGDHGQANAFLECFIASIGLPSVDVRQALVRREVQIGQDDRFDILIDGADWTVAIENKPFAKDGERQIERYAAALAKRRGSSHKRRLVYVTPDGQWPSAASVGAHDVEADETFWRVALGPVDRGDEAPAEDRFVVMSDIVAGWRACSAADHVDRFLADLSDYLDAAFGKDEMRGDDEIGPRAQEILGNDAITAAAIEAAAIFPQLRRGVIAAFLEELNADFNKHASEHWYSEVWNTETLAYPQVWVRPLDESWPDPVGLIVQIDTDLHRGRLESRRLLFGVSAPTRDADGWRDEHKYCVGSRSDRQPFADEIQHKLGLHQKSHWFAAFDYEQFSPNALMTEPDGVRQLHDALVFYREGGRQAREGLIVSLSDRLRAAAASVSEILKTHPLTLSTV